MIDAVTSRNYLLLPVLAGAAVVYGAMVAVNPYLAAAAIGAGVIVAICCFWPVANLALLLLLTAIVPYGLQNQFGLGGGAGSAGLLPSDALLLMGMAVAILLLLQERITPRAQVMLMLLGAVLFLAFLGFVHGILLGREKSAVGSEFRFLLGYAAFLPALPVLADAMRRQRFYKALIGLGLLLGLWAIIQWTVALPFSDAGDAGVRSGVLHTSGGRGQIQGGLFGFPIAVILSFSVLLSGRLQSRSGKLAVAAVMALNAVGVLLTFERTFWVATVLGCLVVIAKAGAPQRARAIVVAPFIVMLAFGALSTFAPGTLTTAQQRLLSIGQYNSDTSVRYRVVESEHVLDRIKQHPALGSGFADSIYWGRPWEQVPATEEVFSHNSYLWLSWKIGLLSAALLVGLILWAALTRGGAPGPPVNRAMRNGAQAALLALLVEAVTFPSLNSLSVTPAAGILLAMVVLLTAPRTQARARTVR
jgi:hypothetical protein